MQLAETQDLVDLLPATSGLSYMLELLTIEADGGVHLVVKMLKYTGG